MRTWEGGEGEKCHSHEHQVETAAKTFTEFYIRLHIANARNVRSRPFHYLMFWVFGTVSPWAISSTGFTEDKIFLTYFIHWLLQRAVSPPCSVLTESRWPKRASSSQPPGSIFFHGCNTLQQQGSIAPIFSVSLIKNWSGPKWQISGLITTSAGLLCLQGLLLLMEPEVFGNFSVVLGTPWQLPVSWWGPLILSGDSCYMSNNLKYSAKTIIYCMLILASEIASNPLS